MCVDVFPIEWAAICDICGYTSTHATEDSAEEAAQHHKYEGCGYR